VTVNFDPFAAKINSAIVFAVQSGSIGVATLLRGVRAGRIGLHISVPENTSDFKAWAKEMARKPALCLVGDDDGRELGAGAWKGYAYRLARWSSRVVLHCAGAEVSHYEWRKTCLELQQHQGSLRVWERGFVASLPNFNSISVKQRNILNEIADRVLGGAP
jgi:hypothetical protein